MNNAKSISELSDIELREAVAVEVMGMLRCDYGGDAREFPKCRHCGVTLYHGENPVRWCLGQEPDRYESSLGAAFEVVEKMHSQGYITDIASEYEMGVVVYRVNFACPERTFCWGGGTGPTHTTLPLGICRAALTAVRARNA